MRVKALSVKFSMIFAYFSSRKSRCPSGMRKRVREQLPGIFCHSLIVKLYVIINLLIVNHIASLFCCKSNFYLVQTFKTNCTISCATTKNQQVIFWMQVSGISSTVLGYDRSICIYFHLHPRVANLPDLSLFKWDDFWTGDIKIFDAQVAYGGEVKLTTGLLKWRRRVKAKSQL